MTEVAALQILLLATVTVLAWSLGVISEQRRQLNGLRSERRPQAVESAPDRSTPGWALREARRRRGCERRTGDIAFERWGSSG